MVHLKRLRAPKSWPITKRKGIQFIARPLSGPHSLEESITLNIILKDMLNHASITRDVKNILNQGVVLVNNKVRKSHKFPVGILDIISITGLDEHYRLVYGNKGRFSLRKINKEDARSRFAQIKNKTILKKQKVQLNFHDGTNLLVDKDIYKTGDTLILVDKKIESNLKFEKGARVYLTGGKHKGKAGLVSSIEKATAFSPGKVTLLVDKENITTKRDFAFVISEGIEL